MGERTAIYPGSFDPVTNGHLDIIMRASKLLDKLTVAVLSNHEKNPLFTLKERVEMLRHETRGLKNVEVDSFDGLLIDYAKKKNCALIVRALRAVSDFDREFQMAVMNSEMFPEIETIFLMTDKKYFYLSSSAVKEIVAKGGAPTLYVSDYVLKSLQNKLRKT